MCVCCCVCVRARVYVHCVYVHTRTHHAYVCVCTRARARTHTHLGCGPVFRLTIDRIRLVGMLCTYFPRQRQRLALEGDQAQIVVCLVKATQLPPQSVLLRIPSRPRWYARDICLRLRPRSAPERRRRAMPLRAALMLVPGLPRSDLAARGRQEGRNGAAAGERAEVGARAARCAWRGAPRPT